MAEVIGNRRITPNMQRVTLGGDGLNLLTYQGYDQWFRLFLQRDGQDALQLPTQTSALWYAQHLLTPKERRPWVRNYTIRAYRASASGAEIDVDFVIHESDGVRGPAVDFALTAPLGTRVGLLDQGLAYEVDRPERERLLVCDETGLPAVLSIIEHSDAAASITALIEVPSGEDRQEVPERENVTIHWLPRPDTHGRPGEHALDALRASSLPQAPLYAYIVGEQALVTGARRWLVGERGVPKNNVSFIGYWRYGRAVSS